MLVIPAVGDVKKRIGGACLLPAYVQAKWKNTVSREGGRGTEQDTLHNICVCIYTSYMYHTQILYTHIHLHAYTKGKYNHSWQSWKLLSKPNYKLFSHKGKSWHMRLRWNCYFYYDFSCWNKRFHFYFISVVTCIFQCVMQEFPLGLGRVY